MKQKHLIIGIVAILIMVSAFAFAQHKPADKMHEHNKAMMFEILNFEPEQMATLQTKRLTFYPDLNENQQVSIKEIFLDVSKNRIAKLKEIKQLNQKPNEEFRYKLANERLDMMIEVKLKLKNVLTTEQLNAWVQMQVERNMFNGKPHFAGQK
jgi:protein CpxP